MGISSLFCKSKKEAVDLILALKLLKGEYVVDSLFANADEAIVEKLGEDIYFVLFGKLLEEWKEVRSDSWWAFIEERFIAVFGDSLRGLTRVFDEGYICGRVGSGDLTIIDGKTKLCRVSKPFGNYLIFC